MAGNNWDQPKQDATAGVLRLNPEGLGDAVGQISIFLSELDQINALIRNVTTISGFGDFEMGQALLHKFARKGAGADDSIQNRLTELIHETTAMRDVFEQSIKNYTAADTHIADTITRTQQNLPHDG